MKVCVIKDVPKAVVKALKDEGCEFTSDRPSADLIVDGDAFGMMVPEVALRVAGIDVYPGARPTHFLTRWFDERSWAYQTMVGIPLVGLMNENLGPEVSMGCAMRFIDSIGLRSVFENQTLTEMLRKMSYRGFVTMTYGEPGVQSMQTGIPFGGIFAVMESVKGKVSEWLVNPGRLLESWICALRLVRYPFPYTDRAQSTAVNTNAEVDKHLWLEDVVQVRKVNYTESTSVGYVTGWHQMLGEAAWRVLRTVRNVGLEGKMYRTDLAQVATEVYSRLVQSNVL